MSERNGSPAFVPQPGEEDTVLDRLGFWAWGGAFEGGWSGTTVWLADAPLPDEVPASMRRPVPETFSGINKAHAVVSAGTAAPARLLAPIENPSGYAMLPVDGTEYDVNPNFVAHIARATNPDNAPAEWLISAPIFAARDADHEPVAEPQPVLIYVVDGRPRGMIALARRDGLTERQRREHAHA